MLPQAKTTDRVSRVIKTSGFDSPSIHSATLVYYQP
jgi:hypothetical protein